jgi:hypothetical protein
MLALFVVFVELTDGLIEAFVIFDDRVSLVLNFLIDGDSLLVKSSEDFKCRCILNGPELLF